MKLVPITLALVVSTTFAQQGVGNPLPPIALEGFSQTPAKGFEDFSGRAVMFEFFAYWCGPCAASVPHVNEIQQAWGPKGLSVIGVTDESPELTEPWIAEHKAEYAYAYDKGGALQRHFGIDSIPRAVIVDASGTVLFNGHPSAVDDVLLAKAVAGALPKPMWEWSGAAKGVRSALVKRAYKSALEQAAKLSADDDGPAILAAVQAVVAGKAEQMKGAFARGDFLGAQETATTLQKELAGLPEAEAAQRVLADLAADKQVQVVLEGQKKLRKIAAKDFGKKREVKGAIEDLQKLKKDYAGTFVESEAQALIVRLGATLSD